MKKIWTWCVNNLIVVIPTILTFVLVSIYIISFETDNQKEMGQSSKNTKEVHFAENNEKNMVPNIPCMCNEQNLIFHHAIPDVCLNSEGQEEITIPLDYGYEVRWCCYNGTVSQYIDHESKTMIFRRVTGKPTLQIRYYVLKKIENM